VKKFSERQIYVVSRKGQKDILMESDSEKDAMDWTEAITAHIRYANTVTSADSNNSIISRNSKGNFYLVVSLNIHSVHYVVERTDTTSLSDDHTSVG
jgi:hypothetical protein